MAHQNRVLTYLFHIAPAQKGLLVVHERGSGKTVLALAFIMHYANTHEVVVVHAPGTRHVWRNNAKILGVKSAAVAGVQYLAYNELECVLQNATGSMASRVLVFDDAHHLSTLLATMPESRAMAMYKRLCAARRVLLLTGTPACNGDKDFRWLINVAAGKPVLPMLTQDFDQQFTDINAVAACQDTWVRPFLTSWLSMLPSVYATATTLYLAREVRRVQSMQVMQQGRYLLRLFSRLGDISATTSAFFATAAAGAAYDHFLLKPLFARLAPESYYRVNFGKVARVCGRYVSFHQPGDAAHAAYPIIHTRTMLVPYTSGQLQLWAAFTMRGTASMRYAEVVSMSAEERFLFGDRALGSQEAWRNRGRCIGNLAVNGQVPLKFKRMLSTMRKTEGWGVVVYSSFWDQGIRLFARMLDTQRITYATITPDGAGTRHALQAFENRSVPVLLLHPNTNKGLAIRGVRQLHIMEPLLSSEELQQLQAHVVWYNSHKHEPPAQRRVLVYQWAASVAGLMQSFRRHTVMMRLWAQSNGHIAIRPPRHELYFPADATPDALAALHLERSDGFVNGLRNVKTADMADIQAMHNTRRSKCCVWQPDDAALKACMAQYDRMCA